MMWFYISSEGTQKIDNLQCMKTFFLMTSPPPLKKLHFSSSSWLKHKQQDMYHRFHIASI